MTALDEKSTQSGQSVPSLQPADHTFRISPIIRLTLHSLYGCLVLPLPLLAYQTQAPVSPWLLLVGVGLGWGALVATLSETVYVNDQGIHVGYGRWVPMVWRKGWFLSWNDITALKPRSTGQGGLVYYFLSTSGRAYLLPMRIAGFARFVRFVQDRTGIDTTDVKPLSQPWMYFILFGFTIFLWLIDGWAGAQVIGGMG